MRRLLAWGRKIIMLNGSPHGVALGFALGLALSLFPIPVAGMIVALAVAPGLRANPAATYLGTAVVNPFTAPLFYFGELWVGARLAGQPMPTWEVLAGLDGWGWWALFREFLAPFGLGAAVVMAAGFGLAYPGVRWALAVFSRATDADQDSE